MSDTDKWRTAYESMIDVFQRGDKKSALILAEKLVQEYPDKPQLYETLGMMYYKDSRLDDAISTTEKLAKLDPNYAMAYTNLSIFYLKKGDKEKAELYKAKATVASFGKK